MTKVSVSLITYNHENFVQQAIRSVLNQEVSFDYEIVIGEDCSTDRTREIVLEFQKRYPGKIRLLERESNVGMQENFRTTLEACTGEYVALLDGDDYWTSTCKLQRQVDFLDSNKQCAMCFHSVVSMPYPEGEPTLIFPERKYRDKRCTTEDLLVENFIPTCSVMFRRGLFGNLPDWVSTLGFSDWPLHVLNAEAGAIGYLSEIMGVYRIHSGGAWSGRASNRRNADILRFYEGIDAQLNFKYHNLIKRQASPLLFPLMALKLKGVSNPGLYFFRNTLMHPYIRVLQQLDLFGIVFFPRIRHTLTRIAKYWLLSMNVRRTAREKSQYPREATSAAGPSATIAES